MTDTTRRALAALATVPTGTALGFHRRPDGSLGDPLTADEVRSSLLNGNHSAEAVLRNVALVRWALADAPAQALPYYMRETGQ
jgi:hypothetical protein